MIKKEAKEKIVPRLLGTVNTTPLIFWANLIHHSSNSLTQLTSFCSVTETIFSTLSPPVVFSSLILCRCVFEDYVFGVIFVGIVFLFYKGIEQHLGNIVVYLFEFPSSPYSTSRITVAYFHRTCHLFGVSFLMFCTDNTGFKVYIRSLWNSSFFE